MLLAWNYHRKQSEAAARRTALWALIIFATGLAFAVLKFFQI